MSYRNNENFNINENINSDNVLLIDQSGNNLGKTSKKEALNMALNVGLDLVKIGDGDIPVCKIQDYKKLMYNKKKKSKSHKKTPKTKEMRFRTRTSDHDIMTKTRQIDKFLCSGHYVRISIQFFERERSDVVKISDVMDNILDKISIDFESEVEPKMQNGYYSTCIRKK